MIIGLKRISMHLLITPIRLNLYKLWKILQPTFKSKVCQLRTLGSSICKNGSWKLLSLPTTLCMGRSHFFFLQVHWLEKLVNTCWTPTKRADSSSNSTNRWWICSLNWGSLGFDQLSQLVDLEEEETVLSHAESSGVEKNLNAFIATPIRLHLYKSWKLLQITNL